MMGTWIHPPLPDITCRHVYLSIRSSSSWSTDVCCISCQQHSSLRMNCITDSPLWIFMMWDDSVMIIMRVGVVLLRGRKNIMQCLIWCVSGDFWFLLVSAPVFSSLYWCCYWKLNSRFCLTRGSDLWTWIMIIMIQQRHHSHDASFNISRLL